MDVYTEEVNETPGGSKKLKDLLNFMENSIRNNAVDKELSDIMNIIEQAKNDPEERRRYMGIMNVIDYEKRDSYNEGVESGRAEGIQAVINTCKFLKQDMEQTKVHIMKQFHITNSKADEYINLYW